MRSVWIGFDPNEVAAFDVARASTRRSCSGAMSVNGLCLDYLRNNGLYTRPTKLKPGVDRPILWDEISDAPMSTEFAISRFLVPHLAGTGWAMFMDCDVLVRGNISTLMNKLNRDYAVYCVKHEYVPKTTDKMDGQIQTAYPRKNWSSVMIFNCDHASNRKLTLEMINTKPGRDLHRFCWLKDKEIGELDASWNWLVGEQPQPVEVNIAHFTNGGPWLHHYSDVAYADEWRAQLYRHAA